MTCCIKSKPLRDSVNRWILFGFNLLCWILSVVTLASCRYVYYEDSSLANGLFTRLSDGECQRYSPAYEFKAGHIVARAFSIIGNLCLIAAFVGISLVLFLLKDKPARIIWLIARILYVVALISVLLTNTIFSGFEECTDGDSTLCLFGPTASINTIDAIFLIAIVSTCWCTPVPPNPIFKCIGGGAASAPPAAGATGATETVKYIEETPDGRKISEVTTFPDGTKKVNTRFEENEGAVPDDEESQPRVNTVIPSDNLSPCEEEVSAYASEDDRSGRHYLPQPLVDQSPGGGRGRRAEP